MKIKWLLLKALVLKRPIVTGGFALTEIYDESFSIAKRIDKEWERADA